MDICSLLVFLALVALGSYIQTVTGFAIALIVTGGVTALGLAPIAFTANLVSLVALANTATAVQGRHSHIDLPIMLYAATGVLLLSGIGLWILHFLTSNAVELLETLLGVVILCSGILLTLRPQPLKRVSPRYAHLIAGALGGLLSGLFGAGGPPLVVHLYRQPLPFPVVRTTLLAILGLMPLVRIGLETYSGNMTTEVLKLSLLCVPLTILTTLAARRFPPPFADMVMRRLAFGLLCVLGLSLILSKV